MEGTKKIVLQVAFLLAFIWALSWLGATFSARVPGGYVRVGKGRGRCGRRRRRPRRYGQVATGMFGDYVASTGPQGIPAGQPFSTF